MMRGFDCEFIVLECSTPNKVRDGSVIYKFKVADSSGSIILNVWGNDGQYIKNGDILRVEGADFQWVSEEEKVRIDAEANKNILSSLKAGAGVSNSTE
ncbi:SOSS complex subunit B-like protein [Zancudomyces culisetae]|uniref:SOSS complex subunit B-like protein n=1 Tax=Zancudomyces culisetae TaxID=1213189 RepID=A0A1R1PH54_ZANCU|nr:SOSS complex subunit B-like protein [Zancudomyces culisetae]|eukprot:OMH80267.1 SOSS complex subunit B-like protein [Zancudomyces culisetae]